MAFPEKNRWFQAAAFSCLLVLAVFSTHRFFNFPVESTDELESETTEVEESIEEDPEFLVYEDVIPRRSTLQEILLRHDFTSREIHRLIEETRDIYNLNRIRAGNALTIERYLDGSLRSLRYQISNEEYLHVDFTGPSLFASRHVFEFDVLVEEIYGRIETSLWQSLIDGGESDRLVMALLQVLRWDVDFTALQRGDNYRLIVEKRYLEGEFQGYGDIQVVQFNTGDKSFYGFLFQNPETREKNYFDRDGRAVKKPFLQVPFDFNPRITSGFSHSRLHPILGTRRPHLGIDYAAPTGTPVLASGSGTVVFVGTRGGYGRMVQIRHPNGYVTSYSHLSAFAVRQGQRVSQGQMIGRVGMTGLATGPHLDYRVQNRRGQFINPQELVTLPSEERVDERFLPEFEEFRDEMLRRLDSIPDQEPFLNRLSVAG